eukprot:12913821-Heterocapsa_arctica.AAC.1
MSKLGAVTKDKNAAKQLGHSARKDLLNKDFENLMDELAGVGKVACPHIHNKSRQLTKHQIAESRDEVERQRNYKLDWHQEITIRAGRPKSLITGAMADYSAKNMVVMELEHRMPEAAKAASGEGDANATFEPRTTDMERIVLHKELPDGRTCFPGTDYGSPAEMTMMCKDTKNCF